MQPTSKVIQIIPNNKQGEEHRGTEFYRYNFLALCEDGSLWGFEATFTGRPAGNWERIF